MWHWSVLFNHIQTWCIFFLNYMYLPVDLSQAFCLHSFELVSYAQVILGEEVAASKLTIFDITKQICDAVQARAEKGWSISVGYETTRCSCFILSL